MDRTFIVVLADDCTTTEMGLEVALMRSNLIEGRVISVEEA